MIVRAVSFKVTKILDCRYLKRPHVAFIASIIKSRKKVNAWLGLKKDQIGDSLLDIRKNGRSEKTKKIANISAI